MSKPLYYLQVNKNDKNMKKEMKLKEVLNEIKEGFKFNLEDVNFSKEELEEIEKSYDDIFNIEVEDRMFELEDIRENEGILYKLLVNYNENEVVIKYDLNMCWWEYSLEDYFRDLLDELFDLDSNEVNKYLYSKEDLEELED